MAKKKKATGNPFRDMLKGKTVALVGVFKHPNGVEILNDMPTEFVSKQKGRMQRKVTADLDILIAAKASAPEVKLAKKLNNSGEANIQISIGECWSLCPGLQERFAEYLVDPSLVRNLSSLLWEVSSFQPKPLIISKAKFNGSHIGQKKALKSAPDLMKDVCFVDCQFNKVNFGRLDFAYIWTSSVFEKCHFSNSIFDGFGLHPKNCQFKNCSGSQLSIAGALDCQFEKLELENFSIREHTFTAKKGLKAGAAIEKCEFKNCRFSALEVGPGTKDGVVSKSKFTKCRIESLQHFGISEEPSVFRIDDCEFKDTEILGGKLQDFQFNKSRFTKTKFEALEFEFMSAAKSEFSNCTFSKLNGRLLDLRGCKFRSCTFVNCKVGVIRVDAKQLGQLEGLEDSEAIVDYSDLENTNKLATAIKKSSRFSVKFGATSKSKKTNVDSYEIEKRNSTSFIRRTKIKGRDFVDGSSKSFNKEFSLEIKNSAPLIDYQSSLAWLLRSQQIHEVIESSVVTKVQNCPLKPAAIKELLLSSIAELQNRSKGPGAKPVKTRANAPNLIAYEKFSKRLAQKFEKDKIFAALDAFTKQPMEIAYSFKSGELSAVFVPDPKKKRTYICSWKPGAVYQCCTASLSSCGGLRGAPCKHLLMVVIAVAKYKKLAGDLDDMLDDFEKQKPTADREFAKAILASQKKSKGWKKLVTNPDDFTKNNKSSSIYRWQF